MLSFTEIKEINIPEGSVVDLRSKKHALWSRYPFKHVVLGDSIAAGHAINADWAGTYGTRSQYGENGNTQTTIVPNTYADLLHKDLTAKFGDGGKTTSFAKSGDKVDDVIRILDHAVVNKAVAKADYVTLCIGANSVLEPALDHIESYINNGAPTLAEIATMVEANLAVLANDDHPESYVALFNKLYTINPTAKFVFTTVYNPYKYFWLEEGRNGFFKPVLDTIPQMTVLGIEIDDYIRANLANTSVVQQLYDRVNRIAGWTEIYVTKLNTLLKNKISSCGNPNFKLTDTKAMFDVVPDRPVSAPKHYNDLVNVEYTRGYDTYKMNWDSLWSSQGMSATEYWTTLILKYVIGDSFDLIGLAAELIAGTVVCVIMPDIDPHPESYGHYIMRCGFNEALGLSTIPTYTVTFNANGASGAMDAIKVPMVDSQPPYIYPFEPTFIPPTGGYQFNGWNTAADGSGTHYPIGEAIKITKDTTLYAQWTNMCRITYKHTNQTNNILFGDDETGHMECYELWINGQMMEKLGKFSENRVPVYSYPYGTRVGVVVRNYNASEITYDDCDCAVYFNGAEVARGYRGTAYEFTLTSDTTVEFQWKIAGSLPTFNAKSWEDCYITTQ